MNFSPDAAVLGNTIRTFYKTLFDYIELCGPITFEIEASGPAWNSRALSSLQNLKNKYLNKYKICSSSNHYRSYCLYRSATLSLKHDPKSFDKFVNFKRRSCFYGLLNNSLKLFSWSIETILYNSTI